MVKDKTKTINKYPNTILTKEERDKYNQWCKELNVSRQYYYPTQYYRTEWNTDNVVEGHSIVHRILHWLVK